MTLSKVLCPLLRYRQLLLDSRPYLVSAIKYKSTQSSAITNQTKTELDTNVKPLGQKVKETTKTVSYLGIIVFGVGVTAALFYAVFSELFSGNSPNNIYTKAMKYCLEDPRVEDKLGYPIKGYGEETRRGRRRHVNHLFYEKNGVKHLRMKFYLEGTRNKATVHLDMVEVSVIIDDFEKL